MAHFQTYRPGSFSRRDETACSSDSMWNATRLRFIAPGLHEREKQARTRLQFWGLALLCNKMKMVLGRKAVAFWRHPRIAHCSARINFCFVSHTKAPIIQTLWRIRNTMEMVQISQKLIYKVYSIFWTNFWHICIVYCCSGDICSDNPNSLLLCCDDIKDSSFAFYIWTIWLISSYFYTIHLSCMVVAFFGQDCSVESNSNIGCSNTSDQVWNWNNSRNIWKNELLQVVLQSWNI